jgi:hypothetical protein
MYQGVVFEPEDGSSETAPIGLFPANGVVAHWTVMYRGATCLGRVCYDENWNACTDWA